MLFNLVLPVLNLLMFSFHIFNASKNNLTALHAIKNKVMNNVINPTGAGTTDTNDPIVTLPPANNEKLISYNEI